MSKSARKLLVLLDTHAILHRAFHAMPDFAAKNGDPTGALYGLSVLLLKLIKDLKPDYIAACYDLPGPTFRKEVYIEYKAGRAKADEALIEQIKRSRDIFAAFHIPIFERPGFEADDLIGTIAEMAKKEGDVDVIIASGDMDTMQLVDGTRVRVYTLKKGINDTILYDEDGVRERYGFDPKLLADFKGLRGDPSDNIPGIKGVGEVTAQKLLAGIGSIENIYATLDKKGAAPFEKIGAKGKTLELIKNGREEALFSKMLGTIRRDVPVEFDLDATEWKNGNPQAKRAEQSSYDGNPQAKRAEQSSYDDNSEEGVLKLFEALEFRSLRARVLEAFGAKKEERDTNKNEKENEEIEKPNETIPPERFARAAVAFWLLNSNRNNPSLERMLDETHSTMFVEAEKKIFKELDFSPLRKIYDEMELPLIPILAEATKHGMLIDTKYLADLAQKYHTELSKLEQQIWKLAGVEFNINSPKQMGEIIFDKLNLGGKKIKRTAGGAMSTRAEELEKLSGTHPIFDHLLEYREIQKLLSTYIDAIPSLLDEENRLHATFVQTGTTTGRFASQNPNVQNIPIKSERGRAIRHAFVASLGHSLVSLDYSQIDLRAAALLSGDKKLLALFNSGADIHTAVASEVFYVPPERVDVDMRRKAKVINFGIIYGMGVSALQKNLGTTRAEAQTFYDTYFETFSGLATYLETVTKEATARGYTETFFGRRRYFPALKSFLPYMRAMAERAAANAPIQGTASDVIKIAMIRADKSLRDEGLIARAHLLLQVHDELVYEIEEEYISKVIPLVKSCMENVITKPVAFIVHEKQGKNWGVLE